MPKLGFVSAVGTSIPIIIQELIDVIRDKNYNPIILSSKKESRSIVIEKAIMLYASKKGILKEFLKNHGYSDEKIKKYIAEIEKF